MLLRIISDFVFISRDLKIDQLESGVLWESCASQKFEIIFSYLIYSITINNNGHRMGNKYWSWSRWSACHTAPSWFSSYETKWRELSLTVSREASEHSSFLMDVLLDNFDNHPILKRSRLSESPKEGLRVKNWSRTMRRNWRVVGRRRQDKMNCFILHHSSFSAILFSLEVVLSFLERSRFNPRGVNKVPFFVTL